MPAETVVVQAFRPAVSGRPKGLHYFRIDFFTRSSSLPCRAETVVVQAFRPAVSGRPEILHYFRNRFFSRSLVFADQKSTVALKRT